MSCDICGRGSCEPCFHSFEEQDRYSYVIEAFDRARELRAKVRRELDEEAIAEEKEAENG
jgi:transcription elongation factor Elf1